MPNLPVIDGAPGIQPGPRDVVVSVHNRGKGELGVTLKKPGRYGPEYTIVLEVPEAVFQPTLFAIIRHEGMTLAQIGEIHIPF